MRDSVHDAARGIIDLQITPSVSDRRAVMRADPHRFLFITITLFSRIGAFALAAGLTGAVQWGLHEHEQDILPVIVTLLMGGVFGLVAFRMLVEQSWKRRLRQGLLEQSPCRVTCDGESLMIEDDTAMSRVQLSSLDRLVATPAHLILFRGRVAQAALPKAAFHPPETFDAFATFLRGAIATPDS